MMTVKRLTCLWPGLARLWFRGRWLGLLNACAFAALVNVLIATTLLWTEVAPNYLCWTGWAAAFLWWIAAAGLSLRDLPKLTSIGSPDGNQDLGNQGLFVAAQTEYLKGNWIEAEACLRKVLGNAPRDVESLLLLATIQRRTRRHDEARVQLQNIARLDAADRWRVELRRERQMLRRETQREKVEKHAGVVSLFYEAAKEQTSNEVEQNENEAIALPEPAGCLEQEEATVDQATPDNEKAATEDSSADEHDRRDAA